MKTKSCECCGNEFNPRGDSQRFCSTECRKDSEKFRARARARAERAKREAQQKHLDDVCRAAKEADMTYGKYVAAKSRPEGHGVPLINLIGGKKK